MYNGPKLPPDQELPFSLNVEFLMAAGAGKSHPVLGHLQWTETELRDKGVVTRQGLRAILENFNDARGVGPGLIQALTANEKDVVRTQLQNAHNMWRAATKEMRQRMVADAISKHNLPGRWQDRLGVFAEWAKNFRSQDDHRQRIASRFADCGFIDMRAERSKARGFKKFLFGENLPYFSRDSYSDEVSRSSDLLSERKIVERIEASEGLQAVLLHGPGGFGKTRLAYEICQAVDTNLSLQIDVSADYGRLKSILADSETVGRLLLFQDYAENVITARPARDFCDDIRDELGIQSTLILCSRSSGAYNTEMVFSDFEPESYRLDKPYSGNNLSYEQWLVSRISDHFDLGKTADVVDVFREVPFLAAFAGYLKLKDGEAFSRQFGIAGLTPDFISWAHERINSLARFGPTSRRRLAEVALALPLHVNNKMQVVEDAKGVGDQIFEALEDDFWLEEQRDEYCAIHDVLADALVSDHLFGSPRPEKRLVELLSTACEKEYLRRALNSLSRISAHLKFQDIDAVDVLIRLEKKYADIIQQNAFDIVRSSLVPGNSVVSVVDAVDSIFEGLKGDKEACRYLSRVVADTRKSSENQVPNRSDRISYLLRSVSFDADAKVLANLVWHDPEEYLGKGTAFLMKSTAEWDASFLISATLQNGVSLESVGPCLLNWLDKYSGNPRAAFVFIPWFEAFQRSLEGSGVSTPASVVDGKIAAHLASWCQRFGEEYYAAKVLIFWLSRASDPGEPLAAIEKWLELHADGYMATHVIQAALRHGRPIDEDIADFVVRWFTNNNGILDPDAASYLLKELKDAGASHELFSDELLRFIASEAPVKARRDACNYWLHMGGDPEKIEERLRELVEADPLDEHVRFVFQSWEAASPCRIEIWIESMEKWLKGNTFHPRAPYVFNIWYENKLPADRVRPPLLLWLARNPSNDQYPVVLSSHAALDLVADETVFPFKKLALVWLAKFARHPNSNYLFQAWIKRNLDTSAIVPAIRSWLEANPEHQWFPTLLSIYASADPDGFDELGLSEDRARSFLKKANLKRNDCRYLEYILSAPYGSDPSSELGAMALERSREYLDAFGDDVIAAFLIAKVLHANSKISWILPIAMSWLDRFGERHRANLVLQSLLATQPEPTVYESDVARWISSNNDYKFAGALLVAWARAGCNPMRFRAEAVVWLETAREGDEVTDVREVERIYLQSSV